MFWNVARETVTVLGGAGILVAALAYLCRVLVTHWMDKDVEKYKAGLQAEHVLAVERLRSHLSQQAIEHEVKYRRNDERIAKCLDGVYRRLFTFFERVSNYVKILESGDEPSKEEKLTSVKGASEDFWRYFLLHRLYLPRPLFQRTREFAKELTQITNDFTESLRAKAEGVRDIDPHFWSEAFTAVNERSSGIFATLVDAFQKRLGVFDDEGARDAKKSGTEP